MKPYTRAQKVELTKEINEFADYVDTLKRLAKKSPDSDSFYYLGTLMFKSSIVLHEERLERLKKYRAKMNKE